MSKLLALVTLLCSAIVPVNTDEGWFWHVTDFHWDFSYWNDQLSCNGDGPQIPGAFGDQWCDSPWRLIEETIKGMKTTRSEVDFVLWTGDSVPHVNGSYLSTDINKELVRNITSLMKDQFPGVRILATFGNHDYFETNMFPPHGNQIYNATYDIWQEWINDTTQEANFLKGGYYSVKTSANIRVIALNTNLYYTKNNQSHGLADPAGQFAWLEHELKAAANRSEKVILTGHVPPGYTTPRVVIWMSSNFNSKFVDILARYRHVITGMHFGHEHHDNFRIIFDDLGRPSVVLFIAPSVTPWRFQIKNQVEPAHNPGIRLVKYDRRSGKQLDIYQYYFDLDTANNQSTIHWKLGYKATELYNIPDVGPAAMVLAVERLKPANSLAFQSYINWYNTNAKDKMNCNSVCQSVVLCGIQNVDEGGFASCFKTLTSTASHVYINYLLVIVELILVHLP